MRLEEIAVDELNDVIVEAWLCRAPKRLAEEYINTQLLPPPLPRPSRER